jgi:hypothetical protein
MYICMTLIKGANIVCCMHISALKRWYSLLYKYTCIETLVICERDSNFRCLSTLQHV